jgi:hypothetical protein
MEVPRFVLVANLFLLLAKPAFAQNCQDPPGFRIACLGDSNTSPPNSWCNLIAAARNCGVGGTAFFDTPFGSAATQLEEALLDPELDAVVFAFVTNDVGYCLTVPAQVPIPCTAEAIVDEAEAVYQQALDNLVNPYIATGPPRFVPEGAEAFLAAVNAELIARFPAEFVIDFTTGFGPELFADGIHLNDEGQVLRAERVIEALPEADAPWAVLLVLAVLARHQRCRVVLQRGGSRG